MQINLTASTSTINGHSFNPKNYHERKSAVAQIMLALQRQKV